MQIVASKYKEIWNKIITILTTAQGLPDTQAFSLGYVKEIRAGGKGKVADIPELPAIIVSPAGDREEQYNVAANNFKKVFWKLSIQCWLKAIERDTQITGEIELSDGSLKGITDFIADVKNIINNYPDLDGKATNITFPNTDTVFEVWPNQVADITLQIEFIVKYNAR